jgi:FMN phosphatase YigB (HAD superfamily)
MTQPALILFDFDDTLCVTERYMSAAFYEALRDYMKAYRPELTLPQLMVKNTELYRKHGSSLHGWMHELGKDMDFTLDMFAKFAPVLKGAVMPHTQPNTGLLRRLGELQEQGHELAILTLGHRDYCLPILERIGISKYIPAEKVFDISVMEGRLKRDEETYHHLLKHHLKAKYRHKYMFEDSMANLMAAHKAGFGTFLIGAKRPPEELGSAIDHQAATVNQALDILMQEVLPA